MIKGKSLLSAEVGIGVIDKWQGKGLGSELMGRIIVEARGLGFKNSPWKFIPRTTGR